ncbi:MAG: hypothetical protein H6550_07540 [Chitinophagales bacterium]|nr:hypothetical protein [Chitinophagales bacterium]
MALSETWFLDGYIDFELQKYKLLAYLQEVNKYFNDNKLYPQLADVIFHYRNLEDFRKNKQLLQNSFPRQLSQVNLERLQLVYTEMLKDNAMMAELEEIVSFAIDRMKHTIDDGTGIYELVEQQLNIEPVGIMPLYKNEGYMLLRYKQQHEVHAYNYTISMLQHNDTRYKAVKMVYIDRYAKNISITYEHIKTQIIKSIRTLPNPAVYFVESNLEVPLKETLLPIAKRALVRQIEAA